jgi:hypothetical protein
MFPGNDQLGALLRSLSKMAVLYAPSTLIWTGLSYSLLV